MFRGEDLKVMVVAYFAEEREKAKIRMRQERLNRT